MAGDSTDRSGKRENYDYAPIAGTFWMHSHEGLQEQQLMSAPLIVHDQASAAADLQEVVMMLHDFSFKSPEELLAGLTHRSGGARAGAMPGMKMDKMGSGMSMSGMMVGSIP
jgi:FtsP/CotA-like multicopper oxidase with cupredoxin domain